MKNFYVGLDIGTDSVGWAATDTEYNLLKFKGNAQWGIRLIEESNTAEERRAFRTARRRTQRNRFRLQCLEILFDSEIAKVDPGFFPRLHESNLYYEDRTADCKYTLFNDKEYTDIDYHKEYPTIYHLRKRLIESGEAVDIRLLYLAVSHIVKNRGHFLFDSDISGGAVPSFSDVWNDLAVLLSDELEISLDCADLSQVQDILKNGSMSITAKKAALGEKFAVTKKDKQPFAILSLLAGASVNTAEIFADDNLKDTEAAKITFSSGYDEKAAIYESVLGDRFELIERLKAVYDWALLAEILKGEKYLSYAKCATYEKHKSDLKLLKAYVKKYVPEKYDAIFNDAVSGAPNYCAYSGHSKKSALQKKCSQQDFIDFLKKQLPKEPMSEEYSQMYDEIAASTFMPKVVTKDNAVIPMQVNRAELVAILDNAEKYFPFLSEIDNSGKSVKEKILDVFSFRIPYYVGPLNPHSDKAWLVRTGEKIYPWNFEKVVDLEKSAEKFIENLTSKCTYIPSEDVLPKNSLLYCEFAVLNELNNLKINGEEVSIEVKQAIYDNLFKKYNKVTASRLKNYLKTLGFKDFEISGIDGDFKNSLKSYRDLERFDLSDSEKEEIIRTITIFGDDRKLLKKRIKSKFGEKLSDDEIAAISKLKYSDWGRLSEKFLSGVEAVCVRSGEVDSIIGFMRSTTCNLMQLLSKDYGFLDAIKEINGDIEFTSLKSEIDALYVSPKVKRPIFQAMQIVEELTKINGCEPKKIFVEVARGEEEKKRTVSRKSRLLEMYKSCKKENEALYEDILKRDESEFRRDALYLYYTQFGRCMYTGEEIPIESIFNRNLYDIDHIYPQSKIKDDSIDNRVLVTKKANEDKGNLYPIRTDVREKMGDFWRLLLSKDLISKKKYERLVRNYSLTSDELSAFINRQLVETRQSTKAIAELLSKRYSSKIVYVKAGLVSEFRRPERFDFVKCRDVNDLHHAKDAYLNIVVGNVYDTRCTRDFIYQLSDGSVSLNRIFDYNTKGAWSVSGEHKSIDTVRKVMAKNNIRFTRYSSKQKGGLFKQTILKKGSGQVPIKGNSPRSDIEKYGGYDKAASTCFSLVSYVEKGEKAIQFVPINLYEEKFYLENPKSFIDERLGVDCEIIIPCVKYNTLVSVDGFRMHISSKQGGGKAIVYKPAMQLVLGAKFERYIKKISRYLEKCAELRFEKPITEFDGITSEENLALYEAIEDKLTNTIFNVKFANIADILSKGKSSFENLPLKKQCEVIMQILSIVHCNVRTGDLTPIGGASKSGSVSTRAKIAPSKSIKSYKIIHQSITGLYEQEIELIK